MDTLVESFMLYWLVDPTTALVDRVLIMQDFSTLVTK